MKHLDPLQIPKGIKYLGEWDGFKLPEEPTIIDKKLTGCGFTELVLTGDFNSCLITPRRTLAENKIDQHNPKDIFNREIVDERKIYYARTDDPDLGVDKDLEIRDTKPAKSSSLIIQKKEEEERKKLIDVETFKKDLEDQIRKFIFQGKKIKLIVTYDSFRKVKEVLKEKFSSIYENMYFVVDEFQSIFTDSRFKPGTELEFVNDLQGIQKVSYVSATPMMKDYLNLVEEFKHLPYLELDWRTLDKSRIMSPEIFAHPTKSINQVAKKIITEFKEGKYQRKTLIDSRGNPIKVVEGKELIFYVNSVKNICDIIRQNKLSCEEVNVICASTDENRKKIRESFKAVYRSLDRSGREVPVESKIISKVPVRDLKTGIAKNKPITFCTKTVYLGADFYSKCARSIVLSDSGTECLAVDITLDLPQIVGRQRDLENPWKNSLEIWFKEGVGVGDITEEQFNEILKKKEKKTENLLSVYDTANLEARHDLAEEYEKLVKKFNYRDHYVAVNHHAGSDLKPVKNELVLISEKRAFDIQQLDYKDRFSVFNRIEEVFGEGIVDVSREVNEMMVDINSQRFFTGKMKRACEYIRAKGNDWSNFLEEPYKTYIQALGIDLIITKKCEKGKLDEAMIQRGLGRIFSKEDIYEVITGYFKVGERYTSKQLKQDLGEIYNKLNILNKPKATDLEKWFEIKPVKMPNLETGKRDMGFEILSIK